MKRIVLLALALIAVKAQAQTQRTILMEEFTNASCPPCAAQNPAFNTLLSNNLTKVVQLKYQTVWPGVDPMNAQNTADVATRVTYYGVNGVPQAVMDGDTNAASGTSYLGAPANLNQAKINARYAIQSPISLTSTYSYNTATDSITSVVTITNVTPANVNAGAPNSLKLHFSLIEMNIDYATPPGTNGETDFYYVMRKMYPNAAGTQLIDNILPGAANALTFTFKFKKPTYIYKPEQMAVVAFVQDNSDYNVLQTSIGRPSNTVDVAFTSNTTVNSTDLCSATINPSFNLVNKGTNAVTSATVSYTVNGAAGGSQNWTGNLATTQSAVITMPAINAPVGLNSYKFSVTNINNGAVDIMGSNNAINPINTAVLGSSTVSPITENFEAGAVLDFSVANSILTPLNRCYVVDKTINSTITQKIGAYGLSDKSYRFNFYNFSPARPGLTFYKQDLNGKGLNTLRFDYAYNGYTGTDGTFYDSLAILTSTDCGATWTEIWMKEGTNLKTTTAANISGNYYPATTDWKSEYITLPIDQQNASELVIRFEGRSGYGNNCYIDNINIINSGVAIENTSVLPISIHPNPTTANLNVEGQVNSAFETRIQLVDALGKVVYTKNITNVNTLNEVINVTSLSDGIYNLLIINGNSVAKKLVNVQH